MARLPGLSNPDAFTGEQRAYLERLQNYVTTLESGSGGSDRTLVRELTRGRVYWDDILNKPVFPPWPPRDFQWLEGIIDNQHMSAALESRLALIDELWETVDNLGDLSRSYFYMQATAPVPGVDGVPDPLQYGSIWYDTSDLNRPYFWDGTVWVDISDGKHDAQVTYLTQSIEDPDTGLTANANALDALLVTVTDIDGVVQSQATQITQLQASIEDLDMEGWLETAVAGNASAIQALDARVTYADGEISSMASEITTLQASVSLLEGGDAALTAVDALTVRVEANENDIFLQGQSITALQGEVTNLQTNVSGQASALSALDIRVTSAEGSITSQASSITALQASVGDAEGNIAGNATAISGLETTVTNQGGQISAISSDLTFLETTVGNNSASITTFSASIDGLEAQYTVKIDNNGHISGFGLASTPGLDGNPMSAFTVLADRFEIAHPNLATDVPIFLVQNGMVYMQNARIENAWIEDLSIGKLTTGVLNADINVGTGRIIWDNGAFIRAAGIGFGTNNQFLEWFGPRPTGGNLNLCSEANAIQYLKTNGDAYFGGTLSAGVLKNAAQSTSTAPPVIDVSIGPYGSNGGTIVTVNSYSGSSSWQSPTPVTTNPTCQLKLYRRLGGGAEALVVTQNFTGSHQATFVDGPNVYNNSQSISGSFTYTDPSLSTSTRTYRLELSARSLGGTVNTQTFGITSTE